MQDFPERFKSFYKEFKPDRLDGLKDLYCEQAQFIDPIHQVTGVEQIVAHFEKVCRGLSFCRFDFTSSTTDAETLIFEWHMHYAHPKLNGGEALVLPGMTVLKIRAENGIPKVYFHRDYYDMGAMVYEHVPIIGGVLKFLKNRFKGKQPSNAENLVDTRWSSNGN